MRPTFLGIGAQRTGTTRLHELLSLHPEIRMPTSGVDEFSKELHYFDRRIVAHDLEWYERQFESEPRRPVRGDVTPSYSTLPSAVVGRIGEYAPDLKLILIIRHPVDRIWSQLKMRISSWSPDTDIDPARHSLRRLIREAETYETILRTDYERTIETWTRVFGHDALLIVLFDEQFTEPEATLKKILRHIGADASWSPGEERLKKKVWSGPSGEIPRPLRSYLARRWLEPTEALNHRLDGGVEHWVTDMRRAIDRGSPKSNALSGLYRLMAVPRKSRSLIRQVAKSRRLSRRLRRLLAERRRLSG